VLFVVWQPPAGLHEASVHGFASSQAAPGASNSESVFDWAVAKPSPTTT
jgi:hypothetical protein